MLAGPNCARYLADFGADAIKVERPDTGDSLRGMAWRDPRDGEGLWWKLVNRNKRNIALDLKDESDSAIFLQLVDEAHVLVENFRPGTLERLDLSPDMLLARNPKLVFGRMTGWGQEGPYAASAGHDINYISLAGALAHFSRAGEAPVPPLNMVGDFGGGGMFLAYGVVCALLEAQKSGKGLVVDTAMVDGSAVLMSMFWAM